MPIGCKAVYNGCAKHTRAVEQMGDVTGNPALTCLTNINVYVCVCLYLCMCGYQKCGCICRYKKCVYGREREHVIVYKNCVSVKEREREQACVQKVCVFDVHGIIMCVCQRESVGGSVSVQRVCVQNMFVSKCVRVNR